MIDEDDPKTPEPASTVPAGEPEKSPKPEGDKPEGEGEQMAPDDEEGLDALADEDEDEEADDEDEQEGELPKRKTSRAQRYKRQAESLKRENEALRTTRGGIPASEAALINEIEARVRAEIGDPPRQEQFKQANG